MTNYVISENREFCSYNGVIFRKKNLLKSWNDAHKLCQSEGASLPILRSEQEMQELLASLKLSPYIPVMEGLFLSRQVI